MFRSIVTAATAASFAVVAAPVPVTAQQALSPAAALACGPGTRLGPLGQKCVALKPKRPSVGTAPAGVARPEGVPVIDASSLAETYDCEELDAAGETADPGEVVAYADDCGAPLAITNTQPYWPGDLAVAAPPPPPPPPPPAVAPPPPPPPPAPPVYAPVQAAGLGGAGLAPVLLGGAALLGLGALVIAADDDDDGGNAAPSTNP